MNVLLPSIVAFALQAAAPQETDAEKLFKRMEERLAAAKTLQVSVKGSTDQRTPEAIEAEVLLGEENRLHILYKMNTGGSADQIVIVSDGKKVKQTRQDQSWGPSDASADLVSITKIGLARAGGGFLLRYSEIKSSAEALKALPVTELKSVGREKVKDVEVETVTYKVEVPQIGKLDVKLCIDPKTALPVYRTMTREYRGAKATVIETYEGFKFDEKIDEAKFKLP